MKKTVLVFMMAFLCLMLSGTAVLAEVNAAEYLNIVYGLTFSDEVTVDEFNAALTAMGADPLETETLTMADAVVAAVRLAGMEELALTDTGSDPYAACAVAIGIADEGMDLNAPLSADTAAELLYNAAEIGGKARRYIGRLSDDNILRQLGAVLDSIDIFANETLNNAGLQILLNGATTGYTLKYNGYSARFPDKNTIRYGHDDPQHLMQLTALLKSLGYDAYVQVEPKVSVYEYMLEWGEPQPPTPTYEVKQLENGRYFAFALEYDLTLEFDSSEEKESLHGLIEAYAKKYDDSFDADGNLVKNLLAGSFWQPLYFSYTEMENEEFVPLTDNVISDAEGYYKIHSISLPENAPAVAEALAAAAPDLSVQVETIYVNPAFNRYITGTDHQ